MNHSDLDSELERLGDALRACATVDLAREESEAGSSDAGRARRADRPASGLLRRPRVLAGGTLGLAGVGTALALALTAGGAAAPPAFAVTQHANGSVTVNLASISSAYQSLPAAESELASKTGADEWFEPVIIKGAATQSGPVSCTPAPSPSSAAGRNLSGALPSGWTPATGGPPVQVQLGTDGTSTVPAGQTGAGPWHLSACYLLSGTFPGVGNTGNTGNTGSTGNG